MMNIAEGAGKIINVCAGVRPGENVVIITDARRPASLGDSLMAAAEAAGAAATKLSFNGSLREGQLSPAAAAAVERAEVLICVTTKTLAYTKAVGRCKARGGRVIAITEATEETFRSGPLEADYPKLAPRIHHVKAAFDQAELVRVTAPGGTDLTLSIKGRTAYTCPGLCREAGQLIGLPAMEVYIAPLETETSGVFVADASGSGLGLLKNPIRFTIERGKAAAIEGKEESKKLKQVLAATNNPASYVIAEFAIGLNPCGGLVGNISVDEGLYGTGHFALGNNLGFGGANEAPEHLDMVYWRPTIELDGRLFMKDGVLCGFPEEQW